MLTLSYVWFVKNTHTITLIYNESLSGAGPCTALFATEIIMAHLYVICNLWKRHKLITYQKLKNASL